MPSVPAEGSSFGARFCALPVFFPLLWRFDIISRSHNPLTNPPCIQHFEFSCPSGQSLSPNAPLNMLKYLFVLRNQMLQSYPVQSLQKLSNEWVMRKRVATKLSRASHRIG